MMAANYIGDFGRSRGEDLKESSVYQSGISTQEWITIHAGIVIERLNRISPVTGVAARSLGRSLGNRNSVSNTSDVNQR